MEAVDVVDLAVVPAEAAVLAFAVVVLNGTTTATEETTLEETMTGTEDRTVDAGLVVERGAEVVLVVSLVEETTMEEVGPAVVELAANAQAASAMGTPSSEKRIVCG